MDGGSRRHAFDDLHDFDAMIDWPAHPCKLDRDEGSAWGAPESGDLAVRHYALGYRLAQGIAAGVILRVIWIYGIGTLCSGEIIYAVVSPVDDAYVDTEAGVVVSPRGYTVGGEAGSKGRVPT